jgi:hypothetical protein
MTDNIASSEFATVELLTPQAQIKRLWQPVIGEETDELLRQIALPGPETARVRDEAVDVLARCVPPLGSAATETGLAVGYVQSGKTISFTTVAALARDNGYQIVIVIAGTSLPLLDQSTRRLIRDLRLETRSDRVWQLFESRDLRREARDTLRATLDAWRNNSPPFMRRTALITVMKHHKHLEKVTSLLRELDLKQAPVLVIDDEADQASLNAAVKRKDESKTYARIKALRERLPHHTFLQYTATPQAPLLLNIIDSLSPRFAEVLTPGSDYVGGRDFFLEHRKELVREIPERELPSAMGSMDAAPESLLHAMQLFFVGVAAGLLKDKGRGNRSMLVHPSQERVGHSGYYSWVVATKESWKKILDPKRRMDDDRDDLLGEFSRAYDDLALSVSELPSKDEIFKILEWAITETVVVEVNSRLGTTPQVTWKSNYSHILVGGQAMDRGFTVEGLTVTYMPRSLGVRNADTVQQRARFFGYKRPYLGYCRVFLEGASIEAYRRYVAHEEDVRDRLLKHAETGQPLSEWKRMFYLDKTLRPTRHSVLELDYVRGSTVTRDWFTPKSPHLSGGVTENRKVVANLRDAVSSLLIEDSGSSRRTEYQRHLVTFEVPLTRIFEYLLHLRFTEAGDSQSFTIIQILLAELLERDPEARCALYFMSAGKIRQRTANEDGEIKNLFQGAAPTSPKAEVGSIYPGDRALASETLVTIQVHILEVQDEDEDKVYEDVPTVAIHLPGPVTEDILVQPQPGQTA